MTETPRDKQTGAVENATEQTVPEHEKVPEAAENIEHTLRRLLAEKEKRREKSPGLYL